MFHVRFVPCIIQRPSVARISWIRAVCVRSLPLLPLSGLLSFGLLPLLVRLCEAIRCALPLSADAAVVLVRCRRFVITGGITVLFAAHRANATIMPKYTMNASMKKAVLLQAQSASEDVLQYNGPTAVHSANHRQANTASVHRAMLPARARRTCGLHGWLLGGFMVESAAAGFEIIMVSMVAVCGNWYGSC